MKPIRTQASAKEHNLIARPICCTPTPNRQPVDLPHQTLVYTVQNPQAPQPTKGTKKVAIAASVGIVTLGMLPMSSPSSFTITESNARLSLRNPSMAEDQIPRDSLTIRESHPPALIPPPRPFVFQNPANVSVSPVKLTPSSTPLEPIEMTPTKEEERKLKEYKDNSPVKLGPAERFLKELLDVPFAFKRIDAMLYMTNFESEIEYLKKSFETLEAACEELRNSRMFLKLLEAVLKTGNRMNVGTNRGDAQTFKLDNKIHSSSSSN